MPNQSAEGLDTFDPGAYVIGYEQLAGLGVGFYPVHRDKSPAIGGKLNQVATLDPIKIRFWAEHCQYRSFAARLFHDSRLLVVDTENPWKHPDGPGPDGELFLGSLLEDLDIALPIGPMVQTASGGLHRYLIVPKGLPIRPKVALWPGIDILANGSSVILPGSCTDAGEYRAVRSFADHPIPEAPRAFIKLIRTAEAERHHPDRSRSEVPKYAAEADTSEVTPQQWWLLFRNRVFRSFWKREGKVGDTTDSAYEYHLAKACLCCGLNFRQAEAVVVNWRRKHCLKRDLRQLRYGIIPGAWREVAPWVERWRAERELADQSKEAAKTTNLILAYMRHGGRLQTPSTVSTALAIPRERAKKAMQRLADAGKLLRTAGGYEIATNVGTF